MVIGRRGASPRKRGGGIGSTVVIDSDGPRDRAPLTIASNDDDTIEIDEQQRKSLVILICGQFGERGLEAAAI